jgi:hypothetical protein
MSTAVEEMVLRVCAFRQRDLGKGLVVDRERRSRRFTSWIEGDERRGAYGTWMARDEIWSGGLARTQRSISEEARIKQTKGSVEWQMDRE